MSFIETATESKNVARGPSESLDVLNGSFRLLRYRARKFRIEVKNVLRRLPKTGGPKLDFQKTRASKNDPCSRYYRRDQFEVLAACMQPVNEQWDYLFAATSELPAHKTCEGRISHRLRVAGSQWMPRLVDVLDETIG